MAMRPKSEMSPPLRPPLVERETVIQELRTASLLAASFRQQVELVPELERHHAVLGNVSDISVALASSLSVLRSERVHGSSADAGEVARSTPAVPTAGGTGANNGAVARTRKRKAKHRRSRNGEEVLSREILTETPENDRFHWRKYGEKKILNAAFARQYYRCSGCTDEHKCPAKKYVQRQNNSHPPLFLVTLIDEHTCDTLFPDEPPSSSSSTNQHVLDFTKASMASPSVGATNLKKEEDAKFVAGPSYTYDEFYSRPYVTVSERVGAGNGDQVSFLSGVTIVSW